jgi:hypothetical protein
MKIFKTKKVVFAALTAVLCISSLSFFQSCSNNEDIPKTSNAVESRIQEISIDKIPQGIKPIVLKDKEELYKLIEKLDSIKLVVVPFKKSPRFKVFSEAASSTSTIGCLSSSYQILITMAWSQRGEAITVSSTESGSWFCASWTQNTGVASWDGDSKIDYNVTGTVKLYVLINWSFFEIDRKNMYAEGWLKG